MRLCVCERGESDQCIVNRFPFVSIHCSHKYTTRHTHTHTQGKLLQVEARKDIHVPQVDLKSARAKTFRCLLCMLTFRLFAQHPKG